MRTIGRFQAIAAIAAAALTPAARSAAQSGICRCASDVGPVGVLNQQGSGGISLVGKLLVQVPDGMDSTLSLHLSSDGTLVPTTVEAAGAEGVYWLTPSATLEPLTDYEVRGATDTWKARIRTAEVADNTAPRLHSVSASDNLDRDYCGKKLAAAFEVMADDSENDAIELVIRMDIRDQAGLTQRVFMFNEPEGVGFGKMQDSLHAGCLGSAEVPFLVPAGTYTVSFVAIDKAGNESMAFETQATVEQTDIDTRFGDTSGDPDPVDDEELGSSAEPLSSQGCSIRGATPSSASIVELGFLATAMTFLRRRRRSSSVDLSRKG